ncbi:hypothetical protein V565_349030, partial [Rhizoctonia solani 123E]
MVALNDNTTSQENTVSSLHAYMALHSIPIPGQTQNIWWRPGFFETHRNDLPVSETTAHSAVSHLWTLYVFQGHKHNLHWSPYNDFHPDPLERLMQHSNDVDYFHFLDDDQDVQWFLKGYTANALAGAYKSAVISFGDAVAPSGWDWTKPFAYYNWNEALERLGYPWCPTPPANWTKSISFCTWKRASPGGTPRGEYGKIKGRGEAEGPGRGGFWIGTKYNSFTNIAHVGYMRSSPALVSAERRWACSMGLPLDGPSEDSISDCDPEDSASNLSSIKEDDDLPETDKPHPASPGSNMFDHEAWARRTKAECIRELADQGPIGYWLDAEAGFPVGQPCLEPPANSPEPQARLEEF